MKTVKIYNAPPLESEAERYGHVREVSGLSGKDFAASLGITAAQSSNIEAGRRKPSREVMEGLSEKYAVNLNWLVSGTGEPFRGRGDGSPGSGGSSGLPGEDNVFVRLVRQEASAGPGRTILDYPETERIPVPPSLAAPYGAGRLLALTVRGDSMTDEHICDGDIVLFHPGKTEGNAIYVLSVGRALLVKRVAFDPLGRRLTLISANPLYPPRVLSGRDLADVKIEGRVIACLHRV